VFQVEISSPTLASRFSLHRCRDLEWWHEQKSESPSRRSFVTLSMSSEFGGEEGLADGSERLDLDFLHFFFKNISTEI